MNITLCLCVHSHRCSDWRHNTDCCVKDFQVNLIFHLYPTTWSRDCHYGNTDNISADVSVKSDDITEMGLH